MTDADALLSAVVAAPDDDLPRLVYADFAEENGDPARGEFIRVQCELAAAGPADPRRPALEAREAELLAEHRRRWALPVRPGQQVFRRGFVEVVYTTAERLLAVAAHLLAVTPVRHLRLVNADRRLADLADLPVLARVESLDLANNHLGAGGRLARLLADARLDNLRSLGLRNNRLWADGLAALTAAPAAARLARLDLSGNPVGDAGLEHLAAAGPAGLRHLVVRNDEQDFEYSVHPAGAAALAGSPVLAGLRSLDLAGHYVGDAGAAALAGSPRAAGLEALDLSDNEVGGRGPGGVEALVRSPHLGRLRRLNLADNRVDDASAELLANWARLAHGLAVDLRGCEMSDRARRALRASPWAARLTVDT